jgi:peptidoglycan DL-endopeptidase CwlO
VLRVAIVLALTTATLAAVAPALGDPIGEKQAEAQRVIAQIEALNHRLDRASEAYDGATYRLGRIRASLRRNERELATARRNVRVALRRLGFVLRDIYVSGTGDSTIAILLGAHSLNDAIDEVDTQNRILRQASQLLAAVRRYRAHLADVRERLRRTRRAQERLVARRAAEKARIVRGLAEEHRLLISVQTQIAQLRREEALRQAELAAAAAARLAQQRVQEQQALRATVVGATTEAPGPEGLQPVTVVPPSQVGTQVVSIAEQYLGYPYVFGAEGPDAFDCSGLVSYVFAQAGIWLPHFAAAQWNYGVYVAEDELQPGDLVFFANLDHVGIYIGGGEYIQAPHPGDVVRITPLSEPWSAANYYGAKRITG